MSNKRKIVLEFVLEEVEDYDDPDYTELNLVKIKLGRSTTATANDRDRMTERWGQSDQWHVDIHNDILDVIDTGSAVRYD